VATGGTYLLLLVTLTFMPPMLEVTTWGRGGEGALAVGTTGLAGPGGLAARWRGDGCWGRGGDGCLGAGARPAAEAMANPGSGAAVSLPLWTLAGGALVPALVLAAASNAIIIGFQVIADEHARALAEREGVEIRLYRIIYQITDDIRKALEGMLAPRMEEKHLGRAEVRQIFRISRNF